MFVQDPVLKTFRRSDFYCRPAEKTYPYQLLRIAPQGFKSNAAVRSRNYYNLINVFCKFT